MPRKERASVILTLLILLISFFLLSVFSNMLAFESQHEETKKSQSGKDAEEPPSILLFKVSPTTPRLFWRVSTADYYTGFSWLKTTDEKILEEIPQYHDANATKTFTVEIDSREMEIFLPLASPDSALAIKSIEPFESLSFYEDAVGDVYKIRRFGETAKLQLAYEVSLHEAEIDDRLISFENISEEIWKKYLQLPDVSNEVQKFAEDLKDQSYSILDQVLADVQYLRTHFVYDTEGSQNLYESISRGSDVSFYLRRKKGICIDAATLLAVVLRIQKIPARISFGYKPGIAEGNKLLYYTTGGHALTEVFFPPYGWIQFDATPPLEEDPLLEVLPFKKESSPGSRLFYQLSITNRRNFTDSFRLFVDSKQKWNISAAPEELRIEAFQTADALLEVAIPENANLNEKDVVTVTVASLSTNARKFSSMIITQVGEMLHISTTTTLRSVNEAAVRGDLLWVNGTVLTINEERVDNMTIFIFLTKTEEAEGVVVGRGYSIQGDFHIHIAVPRSIEIGDYQVVLISLGTTQYAPSDSYSVIKVLAKTRIEFGSADEFLLDYGAIYGRLLWDNGTGFSNALVSLEIASQAAPSEIWNFHKPTLSNGIFRIETTFENPGLYDVKASFSGNEYILEAEAKHAVKLKRGQPVIQIFGGTTAIRGEVFNITGTVQFEGIGVWGAPLTVSFDNQLLTTIETRDNGSYTFPFLLDSENTLGHHILTVALKEENVSAFHDVALKSKTRLTTQVSDVAGGMFLLLSTSLSDDHDLPLQGAEIVVDDYGLSCKTDENGNLTVILDTVKFWPENLVLTARFEGSELYLPVTSEKEVALEPIVSLSLLVPLISPTFVIVAFAYTKHLVRKRQVSRQIDDVEAVKKSAMLGVELKDRSQQMQLLKIVLPEIETRLPNVWGVRDKLRIEFVLDGSVLEKIQNRDVEVFIDEENVASAGLSQQGRAEISHVFVNKGEHKIRAMLQIASDHHPWNAEIKIHVVDYAEEIVRLYNGFLRKLTAYGIYARNEMTAREVESLILGANVLAGDIYSEALRKVTTCFEKAEYSNHMVSRKDYEITYLSLEGLNIHVKQDE